MSTLYNFYENKNFSGEEIENLLIIEDQDKSIYDFQNSYYKMDSIHFYLGWFTKDIVDFYSNYQKFCKKLFAENIEINYFEERIYDCWLKKQSNNKKQHHNFITIFSGYKKLAKLGINGCLDESILFSTLRKIFDSIYQIKHDISWDELNEKRKNDEINIIGDLFSPITDKLEQVPNLRKYVFSWFFEIISTEDFSIFKNKKYSNKFYDLLNFYSHNEPYDDSFFLNINTLKIKAAFEYEFKSWYGYYPFYFQKIIDNKILFFLEKEKIDKLIDILKQKINENFKKNFCEKFRFFLINLGLLLNWYSEIFKRIDNGESISIIGFNGIKMINQYFEFLNLDEINKINSQEDIRLLIPNEEINNFEKLKTEINNFSNQKDYKKYFKFLKNKIKNIKFKCLKNKVLDKSELIEEIKKLSLFKDHNKMINEPKKINFLKLYHYVNDNDFKEIKEKFFDEALKNECLAFFSTIKFIYVLYQRFIPLILFSNDLISKEDCFSLLSSFEWDDSQELN